MSETRDGQRYYDTGDTTPKFLKSVTEHPDVQKLIVRIVKLEAENARLQEALEKIVSYRKWLKQIVKNEWRNGYS